MRALGSRCQRALCFPFNTQKLENGLTTWEWCEGLGGDALQNLTTIVAVIALLFSFSGLTVSILAYRRDRSRVRAWSSVEWVPNGPETSTVRLRIRIANGGRRPVALMF